MPYKKRTISCELCGLLAVVSGPSVRTCQACIPARNRLNADNRLHQSRERLLSMVRDATPSACIEWPGRVNKGGYGQTRFENWPTPAHRAVFQHLHGKLASDHFVLHSCDNRLCINPFHLRVGSAADNAEDRDSRGRHRAQKGSDRPQAKLTAEKVREIRQSARTIDNLAEAYGVNRTTVWNAKRGKTWRHVQ